MEIADAAKLKEHLSQSNLVEIEDADGSKWGFKVRPVSMMLWDPKNEWYSGLMAKDAKAFQEKIADAVASPPLDAMRNVLVNGIHEPKVSMEEDDESIWVEDLLRKDLLARKLYTAIAQASFDRILKVQAPEDAKSRPPS